MVLLWIMSAIVAVGLIRIGWVFWVYRLPHAEVAMTEEEWENLYASGYEAWATAHPDDAWYMVLRRDDGLYYPTFLTRGSARRFRERWLPLSQTRLR